MKKIVIKKVMFSLSLSFFAVLMQISRGDENLVRNELFFTHGKMDYQNSKKLAKQQPDKAESKLIIALLKLHDEKSRDIAEGLEGLKALYESSKIPDKIWCEATLSYARMSQLYQRRPELFSEVNGIDVETV